MLPGAEFVSTEATAGYQDTSDSQGEFAIVHQCDDTTIIITTWYDNVIHANWDVLNQIIVPPIPRAFFAPSILNIQLPCSPARLKAVGSAGFPETSGSKPCCAK